MTTYDPDFTAPTAFVLASLSKWIDDNIENVRRDQEARTRADMGNRGAESGHAVIAPSTVNTAPTNFGGRHLWRNSNTVNFGAPSVNAAGVITANPTVCLGSSAVGCGVGQPQYFFGAQAQAGSYPYGQITSGSKAGTAIGNAGQIFQFQLAGACARQLQNSGGGGKTPGSFNGTCFGTAAQPGDQTQSFASTLVMPITRGDIYQRISYDLSPNMEVYATLNLAESRSETVPSNAGNGAARSVNCDNAYLPSTNIFGTNLSAAATLAACNAAYGSTVGTAPNAPGTGGAAGTTTTLTGVGSFSYASSFLNIPALEKVDSMRSMRRCQRVAAADSRCLPACERAYVRTFHPWPVRQCSAVHHVCALRLRLPDRSACDRNGLGAGIRADRRHCQRIRRSRGYYRRRRVVVPGDAGRGNDRCVDRACARTAAYTRRDPVKRSTYLHRIFQCGVERSSSPYAADVSRSPKRNSNF